MKYLTVNRLSLHVWSALVTLMLVTAPVTMSRAAADAESTTLFVNLTTDDAWTADMAFHYARQVRQMGHPVVLFLNVRAVTLANKAMAEGTDAAELAATQERLKTLIADGATVYVCGMCTERAGLTSDDWIDGVLPGSKDTIQVQLAPSTKVMSF